MKINEIFRPNFYKQQQVAQAKSRALQRSSKVSSQVVDYALQAFKDQLRKQNTSDVNGQKNALKSFAATYFFQGKQLDQVNDMIDKETNLNDSTLRSLLTDFNQLRLDIQYDPAQAQPSTQVQQPTQKPASKSLQTRVPYRSGYRTAVVAPTPAGDRRFWYDGKNWREHFGQDWPKDLQVSQVVADPNTVQFLAKQVQLKNTQQIPYGQRPNKRKRK